MNTTHLEIIHLQKELQETKETKQTIERLRHHLPMIYDYHMYMEQLGNFPNVIQFPEDGLERLNMLKEKQLPLQSQLSILKTNQAKHEAEKATLQEQLDEKVLEKAQTILEKNVHNREYIREQERIQEKIHTMNIQLETNLKELNIGLTIEQLENASLPFYLEEKWNGLKNEAERLEFENEQLQQEQASLEKQRTFLSNHIAEIIETLLTNEQLEELYSQIDAYKEADYRNKLWAETSERQFKWTKEKKRKEKRIFSTLIGSLVLGLLLGGLGLIFDQSFLFNFIMIIVVLGLGQWLLGKKEIKETSEILVSREVPSDLPTNVTEEEKQAAEQLLMEYDENRSNLSSLQDQLKSIEIQWIQSNEKSLRLKQRKMKLDEQIEEQLEQYPFLEDIELNYWHEFYHTVKQLLHMIEEKQAYELQLDQIKKQLMSHKDMVTHFVKEIESSYELDSFRLQIEMIENLVKRYEQKKQANERLADEIAESKLQQAEIIHQINVYEREIQKLFVIGEVDSEDEFYKKNRQKLEKQALEENIRKTGGRLQAIFPRDAWRNLAQHKPDQSKLEVENEQVNEKIQEIEESILAKQQQWANLNADISKLESSEIYSHTMHQYQMEKEELARMAKEWAVLKTAKEILVETKRKYRDKYLSNVIARTSIYFQKITMNAYKTIIPPQNGKPFQVESTDYIRYQVNELSQGTIDQLYVCLRLAISEIMSEEHHLPFMIDDAFVHFDAKRTKQMIEILTEIGQRQQIILFTCKKEVANSIAGPHIIQLENVVQT